MFRHVYGMTPAEMTALPTGDFAEHREYAQRFVESMTRREG